MSRARNGEALGPGHGRHGAAPVHHRHQQHRHRPGVHDGVGRLEQRRAPGHRVLGDHHPVPGIEGTGDPATAAVVLGLLADAERLEPPAPGGRHPGGHEGHRVGAHGQPTDGRPPSGGMTESTPSATSIMASGRHTVCFESMNQRALAPGLESEVTPLDRVLQQMGPQRLELGGGQAAAHPGGTGRSGPAGAVGPERGPGELDTPPALVHPTHHGGVGPGGTQGVEGVVGTGSESTIMTMPTPRLNTRAISSSVTFPSRRISPKMGGTSHGPRSSDGPESLAGQGPGDVALEPPAGDVGHGVDVGRPRWRPRTAGV